MGMLDDIYGFLLANGLGTNLYISDLPSSPDAVAALYQYAGREPIRSFEVLGIHNERPGLQVQVRDLSDADAETRIYAICALLTQLYNTNINGKDYVAVEALSAPYHLRKDDNDRPIWAVNFQVEKEF